MAWRHLTTLASLATPMALPVERLEGRLHGSNAPVAMTFAGLSATADFVAGSLFTIERRTPVGRLSTPLELRGAAFGALCNGSDLAVADVPPLWQSCIPAGAQLRMPAWVSQEIHGKGKSPVALPPQVRKEVLRHGRREGYELELSDSIADIRRFYFELYRPYISARFKASAVLVDEDHFLEVGRGMTLAILRVDRAWTAGMLFGLHGDTLRLGWFGSSSAPPRRGASEVLDAGIIERAAARGARRVIMGHSRPSLSDGVLHYKSRFGATIFPTRFPQRIVGLQILRRSPALVATLNAAQFLSFNRGQARGLRSARQWHRSPEILLGSVGFLATPRGRPVRPPHTEQ